MTPNLHLNQLFQTALTAHERMIQSNPLWSEIHPRPANTDQQSPQHKLQIKITEEERASIFEKLRTLFNNQELLNNLEMRLYLEQQLSDLVGLEVTSEVDGYVLPHSTVKIRAGAHRRRSFDDQLDTHSSILEAGLSPHRPFFGWQMSSSSETRTAEEYGITLPLHLLEQWQSDKPAVLNWFNNRPILIINPWKEIACIGLVYDVGPAHTTRYQAIASPEIIRSTQLWFPGLSGRACLFLLNHSQPIQPGIIKLK